MIAVGSDLDGVQTQNFAQPQPPRCSRSTSTPRTRRRTTRADVVLDADAAAACAALAAAVRERALDGLADRLHEVRADACGTLDARALRFLDAIRFAVPDDGIVVADMCIPGYWLAGFHTPAHPRKLQIPLGWGTLGYAFPAALGAALAGRGPVVAIAGDGGFLYAPRRAGHGRPGADPAHARDRRRRRLRDAALRPGRDAAPTATASTSSRPTSCALARAFGIRAAARRRARRRLRRRARRARARPRAERARRLDARAARPAAEHLAELVPAQER